jgi:hypothetical protein
MKMTEKRAETATPHLRKAPEQQQQVEHEDAIGDVVKKMENAWVLVSSYAASYGTALALPQLTVAALSYTHDAPPRPPPR